MRLVRGGLARRRPAGAGEIYCPQVRNGAITVIPEYNSDPLGISADPSSTAATTAQADQGLRVKLPSMLEIRAQDHSSKLKAKDSHDQHRPPP